MARYLDLLVEPQEAKGSFSALVAQWPQVPLAALLDKLPPHYRHALTTRFSEGQRQEWLALATESDPALFLEQALNFQGRLQEGGGDSAAVALLQLLLNPEWGVERQAPRVFAAAHRQLDAVSGRGAFGPRVEFLARRFSQEAADPTMLVGFGVASLAYKTARLATLARLVEGSAGAWRFGAASRLLASGVGLAAETPTFVFTTKLARELAGTVQDWSATEIGHELAATGLTLFCLKGMGALSEGAFNAVHGLDPLLRRGALAGNFLRFNQHVIPQAGMFAGIVVSRKLEESLGLRPKLDDSTLWLDSLSTYFQFQVGGALAQGVLGRGYQRMQRDLELRTTIASMQLYPLLTPNVGFEPVLSATAAGTAIAIEELAVKPLQMSQHDEGDGRKKAGGKVLTLHPAADSARDSGQTSQPRRSVDPAAFAKETRDKVRDERHQLIAVMNAIRAFSAQAQVFLVHAERGRGHNPELEELRRELVATYDRFLEKYLEVSRQREAGIPLTARDPVLQREIAGVRADHLRFLKNALAVHERIQEIFAQVKAADPAGLQGALRGLHEKIPELLGREAAWLSDLDRPLSQEVLFAKLAGIMRGVWMKDAYRGTPEEVQVVREQQYHPWDLLDAESSRADDYKIPEWLLAELQHPHGGDWDPTQSLLVRLYPTRSEMRDELAREVSPREALRWGGSYSEPFRTWVGVQVPALLAACRGNPEVFGEKTRGLELFMEPETREASRLAAWWLGQAVHGSGEPRDWAEAEPGEISRRALRLALNPTVDRARAERELGSRGDAAAVGHALLAFLQHPYDARAAIETALASPAAVREDAVSLTGALLGAFHGQSVFHPEWSANVILKAAPARDLEAGTRQVVEFANQEIQQRHVAESLNTLLFGDGEAGNAKVTSLRPAAPGPRSHLPGALVAGFAERVSNGELVVLGAVWDAAVTLGLEAREAIPAEEWRAFRKSLRDSTRRLDAAVKSLQQFRLRTRPALNESVADDWQEILPKIELLEASLGDLRALTDAASGVQAGKKFARIDAESYDKMRELTLQLIDRWEMPALSPLKAAQSATEIQVEDIRALQSGALLLGRSQSPPVASPLFESRGDVETARAVLTAYQETGGRFPPSAENLMELYLQVVGNGYFIQEGRSLANRISPSALLTVMTPAYLEANRDNPTRALRELLTLRSAESPELREAWRVATYVSLRLLEGAQPGPDLLRELRLSFANSTMAQGLDDLSRLHEPGGARLRQRTLRQWNASEDMRHRVLLGLHAFLLAPRDANAALQAVDFSAIDRHQVAERVAGMLAEAHRSRIPLATSPAGVLRFDLPEIAPGNDAPPSTKRPPMVEKDITETLGNAFDPQAQAGQVEGFWRAWAEQRGVTISPRETETFRKNLQSLPGYFFQKLSYYAAVNPLLAKVMLVELGVLPSASAVAADPEVRGALAAKARDVFSAEDWQDHSNGILFGYKTFAKHFFPETYQPLSEAERREWHEKIGDLPAIVVEAINAGGLQSANFLLLVHRFGLSKLGIPERDELPEE